MFEAAALPAYHRSPAMHTEKPPRALLRQKEMAALLKVSQVTLISWRKHQSMPFIKLGRNTVRYDYDAVMAYFARKHVIPPK